MTWTSFDAVSTITDASSQTSYEYNGLKERVLEQRVQGNVTQSKYRLGGVYQRTDDGAVNRLHSILVKGGDAIIAEVQITDDGKGNVGSPNLYSVRTDRLGSTTVVRDPSGKYTHRYYDAFGVATDESGAPSAASPLSSAVGFAGYVQDDSQVLLWMSNRLYDPHLGRALSLDPIVNGTAGQDGANRYAYVYNRPTAFIDPSGFVGGVPWTYPGSHTDIGQINVLSDYNAGGSVSGYAWTYVANSGALGDSVPNADFPKESQNTNNSANQQNAATNPYQVGTDELTGMSGDSAHGGAGATSSANAAGGDGTGDGTTPPSSAANMSDPGEQICPKIAAPTPEQMQATIDTIQNWAPGQGQSVPENPGGWVLFNGWTGTAQNLAGVNVFDGSYTGMNGANSGQIHNMSPVVGVPDSAGAGVTGGFFWGTGDQFQQSSTVYFGATMIFGGEVDIYVGPCNSWRIGIVGQVGIGIPFYGGMTMPAPLPNAE